MRAASSLFLHLVLLLLNSPIRAERVAMGSVGPCCTEVLYTSATNAAAAQHDVMKASSGTKTAAHAVGAKFTGHVMGQAAFCPVQHEEAAGASKACVHGSQP